MQFKPLSLELSKTINSIDKKKQGIFFTPKFIREQLINRVLKYFTTSSSKLMILEPSMGSGEFIDDMLHHFPNSHITGVEKNVHIYDSYINNDERLKLINDDFLNTELDTYDIIIGNPPYFQVKNITNYPQVSGKIDIYILFILKSLSLLKKDGYLLFVVPRTFINTISYNNTRKYIVDNYTIVDIIDFSNDNWIQTKQNTIGLVIQNRTPITHRYYIQLHDSPIVIINTCSAINQINKCQSNSTGTIHSHGFKIKTGEIVWNTYKIYMTDDSSQTLLIHNSNIPRRDASTIQSTILNFDIKTDRKSYIQSDKVAQFIIDTPVILVNRGNGNNGEYSFSITYVDHSQFDQPIVAENHIYKITDNGQCQLENLYKCLQSETTKKYILSCIGNGMVTKTILSTIPISMN